MLKIVLPLLIATLLASCGSKGEPSKAKFRIFSSALSTAGTAQFTGGLLIAGRHTDGTQTFILPYSAEMELDLKKGLWEFETIGWFGASPMEGAQSCAYQRVDVKNNNINVQFSMSPSQCVSSGLIDGGYFTEPRFYDFVNNSFKKLQVKTCANVANCLGTSQLPPDYFKVEIQPLLKGITIPENASASSLASNCIAGGVSQITPPHGGVNGHLELKVTTYTNAAKFKTPHNMAADTVGNIYVSDSGANTIRVIDVNGNTSTLAGNPDLAAGNTLGVGAAARFNFPTGLALYGNYLYVSDSNNNVIKKISLLSGSYGTVTLFATGFSGPRGLVFDVEGNLYVADFGNNKVKQINPALAITNLTYQPGSSPYGLAYYNGKIYITNHNQTITYINANNSFQSAVPLAGQVSQPGNADGIGLNANFNYPHGISSDGSGNLYVVDRDNNSIRKIVISSGEVSTISFSTTTFNKPRGIFTTSDGDLLVSDSDNFNIKKIKVVDANYSLHPFSGTLNSGSNDGPSIPCTGASTSYSFNHGPGEGIPLKAALSVQTATTLSPLAGFNENGQDKFLGYYSDPSAFPICSGTNFGKWYYYMNSSPTYFYCDGTAWNESAAGEDSVKLILIN